MFISVCDLFKIGVGPSSSHTMGPMLAAKQFVEGLENEQSLRESCRLLCILKGSLAFTGKGHATDYAVCLGVNGYRPIDLVSLDLTPLKATLFNQTSIKLKSGIPFILSPETILSLILKIRFQSIQMP